MKKLKYKSILKPGDPLRTAIIASTTFKKIKESIDSGLIPSEKVKKKYRKS